MLACNIFRWSGLSVTESSSSELLVGKEVFRLDGILMLTMPLEDTRFRSEEDLGVERGVRFLCFTRVLVAAAAFAAIAVMAAS